MNEIDVLARQTEDAYQWTNKLLHSIPKEKWEQIPEILNTNVSWQTGHLIVSFYFHSVMVITGHKMDILQTVPMKEYGTLYTDAGPLLSLGKISPEILMEKLLFMQEQSLETIRSLPVEALDEVLVPGPFIHPIAHTKREALDWNVKHTMWHCGQLGILKRIVDQRYDFGLRK